jgi:hypothetical protein
MMSLFVAAVRLALAVAMLIWLPGWLAARLPLRTAGALLPLLIGTAIHIAALALTSFMTPHVSTALWIFPVVTFAIAGAARLAARRRAELVPVPQPLSWPLVAVVTSIVLLAAVLRLLHNYHYDDLEHLFYLTDIGRQNLLFPGGRFLLELFHGDVPGAGTGAAMLSRYPFWAVSYTLLGRVAGVAPGDVYLLLGLGVLALVLAQMAASLSRGWSPALAACLITVLMAATPYLNDSLLNYGGYPFQIGKLFVIMAGAAALTAWRTRQPSDLVPAAVGLFVGPLMHTNNVVGMTTAVMVCVPMLWVADLRRPAARVLGSVALLGVVAVGSVLTGGFLRWTSGAAGAPVALADVPAEVPPLQTLPALTAAVVPAPAPPAPSSAPASPPVVRGGAPAPAQVPAVGTGTPDAATDAAGPVEPPPPRRDRVARRLAFFIWRGFAPEILFLFVATLLASATLQRVPRADRFWPIGAGVGMALLCATVSLDAARQIVTSAFKPGYFIQRARLRAVIPSLEPSRQVVTDPITDVMLRAAGWRSAMAPLMAAEQQGMRLLLFHPMVDGNAFRYLVSTLGVTTIVVNEQVVGAGVADKFRHVDALRAGPVFGDIVPSEADTQSSMRLVVDSIYELKYGAFSPLIADAASDVAAAFWSRPMRLFVTDGVRMPVDTGRLGALLRESPAVHPGTVHAFLNSAIVTLPAPATCTDGLSFDVRSLASFDSPVLIWPLDAPTDGVPRLSEFRDLTAVPRTLDIPFPDTVCGAGPVTALIHSGYWWDYRFDVTNPGWHMARPGGTRDASSRTSGSQSGSAK